MTDEPTSATDGRGAPQDDRGLRARASALDPRIAAMLKRDGAGLVPAVIQEDQTGEVLMLGWMDDEALHRTLTSGRTTFFSRSRNAYWVKGETSGNRQWVREVRLDCDGDTLLVKVHQEGPACHTGDRTCFDARVLNAESGSPGVAPRMETDGGHPQAIPGMETDNGGSGVVPQMDIP